MGHTFSVNHLHVVFSTKERRKMIARDCQPQLWAYLAGICRNHAMVPLSVGGTENHVHLLLNLPAVWRYRRRFSCSRRIHQNG